MLSFGFRGVPLQHPGTSSLPLVIHNAVNAFIEGSFINRAVGDISRVSYKHLLNSDLVHEPLRCECALDRVRQVLAERGSGMRITQIQATFNPPSTGD